MFFRCVHYETWAASDTQQLMHTKPLSIHMVIGYLWCLSKASQSEVKAERVGSDFYCFTMTGLKFQLSNIRQNNETQFSFPLLRLARDRSHRNRCFAKELGCEILILLYFARLKSPHFSRLIVLENNCSFSHNRFCSVLFSQVL